MIPSTNSSRFCSRHSTTAEKYSRLNGDAQEALLFLLLQLQLLLLKLCR
jgi:hypothetical protein